MWSTGDELTEADANFNNHARKTLVVGSLKPNAFGLYDVHGNVAEWTADCYVPSHEFRDPGAGPRTDGRCSTKVVKGGFYAQNANYVRITKRDKKRPQQGHDYIGFRVVRDVP